MLASWLDAWWRGRVAAALEDDQLAALTTALEARITADQEVIGAVALLLQQSQAVAVARASAPRPLSTTDTAF